MAGLPRLGRPLSLVAQTERLLREGILAGRFEGGRLPSAVELAGQLGVSRETVRKAEEILEREGLLAKYRRKGTLLKPPAMALAPARRSTRIAYLQTQYPAAQGGLEEADSGVNARMLQGAASAGVELVVRHAPHTEIEAALRSLADGGGLRGIVFASCGEAKQVRQAVALGLPTVLLDHDLHLPAVSSVREDSAQGGELAVRWLARLGHARIAIAHWRLADLNPWRLEGYRRGLRALGLPRRRAWELFAEISERGAAKVVDALLALSPRPTALLCFNNRLAWRVVDLLRRRGVGVPEELSVLGGGGERIPGIAGLHADFAGMGRQAVQLLLRARPGRAPQHLLFPYTVRPGASSGRRFLP
jgi:DNA-binding LacI/PurR family transcriptional regulator